MAETTSLMLSLRYCLIYLLALAGSVAAQVPQTDNEVPIQINLKPDKNTIMLGEPLFLAFEVTNLSTEKLGLALGGDYRNQFGRPDSFRVSVKSSDGTEVPHLQVLVSMGGLSGWEPIQARATYTVKLFMLHWVTIDRVGTYRVNVRRMMNLANYEPTRSTQRKYSFLANVDTEFTVVPYDEERMGAIINSLGSIMLNFADPRAEESAQALRAINDERVISYFAEVVRKLNTSEVILGSTKSVLNRKAIVGLGRFDDDAAIDALQAAMTSRNQDTRLCIAHVFTDSLHRSAKSLLLKMYDDKDQAVRLTVAYGLARVKTNEARAILHKLLNDEDEEVRQAAGGSLSQINKN